MTRPLVSLPSVLPGGVPARLVSRVLQSEEFRRTLGTVSDLLRQALVGEGYAVEAWEPLPVATGNLGWKSRLLDPTRDTPLELWLWARVTPSCFRVEVLAKVIDPAQPDTPGVLVCLANTANLQDPGSSVDIVQRLCDELDARTAFVEPGPGGSTLRAIRIGKRFHQPQSWVGEAAQVLLWAISPG